ncbi:MAG: cation:proton antiporter [Candidatus Binataceae bacterium]
MKALPEPAVLHFLIELVLLIGLARILGDLMKRLGQASVVGELLAGVILGPSLLGHVLPGVHNFLFPPDQLVDHLVEGVSWLGVIILLIQIGLETDLGILNKVGRRAAVIAGVGAIVSLGAGCALGWYLPAVYRAHPGQHVLFALFVAVAIAISAVPVIAKVLTDLDLMRRDIGMIILAGGAIDDFGGWLLLSVIAALALRGTVDPMTVGRTLIAAALFVAFCYFAGFRIIAALLRWINDNSTVEHSTLTVMIVIGIACAVITQAIGIHAVFGAFAAGLMLGQSARVRKIDMHELTAVSTGFLAPVFFAYSGYKTDLFAIASPLVLLIVLAIACAAKILGSGAGGKLAGLSWLESLAAAVGLNARGGMGVVAALIGLSLGVLTPEMYSILIVVAIVTSIMSPPLLTWILGGVELHPEEVARLARDKLGERLPFKSVGAKFLVLAGGGKNARLGARLAAAAGNHPESSITIFHASPGKPANGGADSHEDGHFNAEFDLLVAAAENGRARVIRREVAAESIVEAVRAECRRGYDAIFAGASRIGGRDSFGGEVLSAVIREARVPIIIARDGDEPSALKRILAPITGTNYSRLALTLAFVCASSEHAEVTALYVSEKNLIGQPLAGAGERELANHILDEARALGHYIGVTPSTRMAAGRNIENAILRFAEQGKFDLMMVGVVAHAVSERLYLGAKVERMLELAKTPIAVAILPEKTELYAH